VNLEKQYKAAVIHLLSSQILTNIYMQARSRTNTTNKEGRIKNL